MSWACPEMHGLASACHSGFTPSQAFATGWSLTHQVKLWGPFHLIMLVFHILDKCLRSVTFGCHHFKACNSVSSTRPQPPVSSLAGTLQVLLD